MGGIYASLSALTHDDLLIGLASLVVKAVSQLFEEITTTSFLIMQFIENVYERYLVLNVGVLGSMGSIIVGQLLGLLELGRVDLYILFGLLQVLLVVVLHVLVY